MPITYHGEDIIKLVEADLVAKGFNDMTLDSFFENQRVLVEATERVKNTTHETAKGWLVDDEV